MDEFNSTTNEISEEENMPGAIRPGLDFKNFLPIIIAVAVVALIIVVLVILLGAGNDGSENSHVHVGGSPTVENEVPATCSADGSYDEVVYCTSCNDILSSTPKTVEKINHTDNGEGVCTVCNNAFMPNPKLTYRVYESEGYAEVKGYGGQSAVVMIAESYNGYPVTTIGYRAFIDNTTVTKVIIHEGITTIKDEAFARCKNLKNPVFPKSLVSVGKSAFKECNAITSLRIPGNIKTVDDYTFYDCNNLKYVIFSEGVEAINQSAFDSCERLNYIVLSKSIKYIRARAFLDCNNQKKVYYLGTPDDYYGISIASWNTCINNSTWYYYSENHPESHEILKYWHYNGEGKIVVWS